MSSRYANTPTKGDKRPKIFVLDTNIILHDFKSIRKFQENDIVIPIAVLEELDNFKKGNDALSYNARGFMREIDKLTQGRMFGANGVPIGKGFGNIKIEPNHPFPKGMEDLFHDDIPDHRILSTAIWVRDNNPGRFVALVTKDINLRMKSKAAGMEAQDYLTDRIEDERVEVTKKEVRIIEGIDSTVLQQLAYSGGHFIERKRILDTAPLPNQLFKFRGESNTGESICAKYDADKDLIRFVPVNIACGIRPRNDEQRFALDACLDKSIELVSLTGGAGTGKTLIALAAALEQEREFDQIILSRPTVILGNQDIGYLPGDQKSKMSPFLMPLMDNLNVIKSQFRPTSKEYQRIEKLMSDEKLLITPLAYIRGRSLGKAFFIIDEAQNLTPHEVKTIVTRAGEGTKMVFTGDIFQIDQPYLDQWSNGLTHLGEKMYGQRVFEHVCLKKGERSELSEIAAKLL